jgi:hypothetical protein
MSEIYFGAALIWANADSTEAVLRKPDHIDKSFKEGEP